MIHDGVDLHHARPNPSPAPLKLPDGTVLEKGQPIHLCEPLLDLQPFRLSPKQQRLVIVGKTKATALVPDGEWMDHFLAEIKGRPQPCWKSCPGISYLTYPFG